MSRISVRLLAFNLLLVFLPVAGVYYLDVYERQLLDAQERAMVQEGRVLAAALSERGPLRLEEAEGLLARLRQQSEARLRIVDPEGRILADSSRLGPRLEADPEARSTPDPGAGRSAVPGGRVALPASRAGPGGRAVGRAGGRSTRPARPTSSAPRRCGRRSRAGTGRARAPHRVGGGR